MVDADLAFARSDTGGPTEDALELVAGCGTDMVWGMAVLDIKHAAKEAPRAKGNRSNFEHLLLGVVELVVT